MYIYIYIYIYIYNTYIYTHIYTHHSGKEHKKKIKYIFAGCLTSAHTSLPQM